jgi:spermidine synthase
MSERGRRYIYLFIFSLSGFSGLIYESIWSHYLKLFLGHAAYAQTLVLIIFMGGMALGAWAAARYGGGIGNLLLAYALVEGSIGLLAVVFHPLFVHVVDFAYESAIPRIDSALRIGAFKWSLSALLILPQSILLGMTFPLMTAGIVRRFPVAPGRTIAGLYFLNSLGAAAGVLTSGFVLIGWVGLPGTILTTGLINIALACVVWQLCRSDQPLAELSPASEAAGGQADSQKLYPAFLLAAGITGAASFLYEIGWIRMLSLVLGSSTHAFELMLSAFIFGLALGGYWIRTYIDRLENVVKTLGLIQIVMGGCALATIVIYGQTFELMRFMIGALSRTEQGYQLFNLFSHALAMLVMLPTTVCAGMTLPLLTYFLLDRGCGERTIGGIYAANTLGVIIGVIAGVQLVMPLLGVKSLITIGSVLDMALGLVLLWYAGSAFGRIRWRVAAASTALLFFSVVVLVKLDTVKMASGVYLHGTIRTNREILFHKDGKTASIDFFRSPGYRVISTNGKTDAAIGEHEPSKDEPTMVMVAALAVGHNEQAKRVAVIGMGSGLTTHTLLTVPTIERVDTIEIEPAMVEGARRFGRRVANTFSDPRSHIHIDDAKAYFTNRKSVYDVIVSEPSNPWVSGVAGIFSQEFYRLIRNHVRDDGLFVQWLHLYHIDLPLVASVVKALSPNFEDYAVYALNYSDMAIIARKRGRIGPVSNKIFSIQGLAKELAYLGIEHPQDIRLRKIGNKGTLDALFHSYAIRPNSDYFPVLDLGAVRTRFLNKWATELIELRSVAAPLMETLKVSGTASSPSSIGANYYFDIAEQARQAQAVLGLFAEDEHGTAAIAVEPNRQTLQVVRNLQSIQARCRPEELWATWLPYLHTLAELVLPYLGPEEISLIWSDLKAAPCYDRLPLPARQWTDLYQALGEREFERVSALADAMLPRGPIDASPRNDYLLMAAMLADVALDRQAAAARLWRRYRADETPLVLRLLSAYIGAY